MLKANDEDVNILRMIKTTRATKFPTFIYLRASSQLSVRNVNL